MIARRFAAHAAAPALGAGTLVILAVLVEGLIRAGVVNRFVVPLPSQVLAAIPRVVAEESIAHRFWQTTQPGRFRATGRCRAPSTGNRSRR